MTPPAAITFFESQAKFRAWLERHHASATELWVGFYKKSAGPRGLTYTQAVDEALCFGWIDGVVKRLDAERFTHRFTPRKPRSTWSLINVGHVERLNKAGLMHPAGLAAFERRTEKNTGIYSFENEVRALPPEFEREFRAHKKAWAFFSAQPPGYRRTVIFLLLKGKQEATRKRRLAQLIAASAAGVRVWA
jgi:uncharacterized protein YdeI (YjbR/CyaY-like superfamily)